MDCQAEGMKRLSVVFASRRSPSVASPSTPTPTATPTATETAGPRATFLQNPAAVSATAPFRVLRLPAGRDRLGRPPWTTGRGHDRMRRITGVLG